MSRASRKERRKALHSKLGATGRGTPAGVDLVARNLPAVTPDPTTVAVGPKAVGQLTREALAASAPVSSTPRHGGGPTTEAGKERSSRNSFKHGLSSTFSRFQLLPGEDHREYTELCTDLPAQFRPATYSERLKLEDMAQAWWLQRRARNLQTEALEQGDAKAFALYLRYETTQRRSYQMAHKDFQEMQKVRLAAQAPSAVALPIDQDTLPSNPINSSPQPDRNPIPATPSESGAPIDHAVAV
jgi:hypothetical protein